LGPQCFSNIGIVGPLTHALTADLGDLPHHDIYALFAGWQAEHEEMFELDVEHLDGSQRAEVARLQRRLCDADYERVRARSLGFFFGEKILLAEARRDETDGLAVVDASDVFWYPARKTARPLGAAEVYALYRGRKLLAAFNP
jgi:hypothetical protein